MINKILVFQRITKPKGLKRLLFSLYCRGKLVIGGIHKQKEAGKRSF